MVPFNPVAERRMSYLTVGLVLEMNADGVRTHNKQA